MVKQVRVNIAGTPYAIATTDSEKYICVLAKKLDEDITKLLDTNENLSVTKAAVFCAMDYLDEYRKSTGSAENMRSQIQDYIADAAGQSWLRIRSERKMTCCGGKRCPAGAAGNACRPSRRAPTGKQRRKREWGRGECAGTKGVLCQRSRSLPRWAVKKCSVPRCSAVRTQYIWAFRASMPARVPAILTRTV